ncbi:MAG: FAD:protein FMN transferase [Chloroflexota bacterium]|nr:FAD:protein FMN transferase [Chloroflexota bacterium]
MPPDLFTRTFPAMGGTVEVQMVGGHETVAQRTRALFDEHEFRLSRFMPDSELCRLNAAGPEPFHASPLLFDAVSEALAWSCVTEGVFDPTVIDALEAAGYDRSFDQIASRPSPGGTTVMTQPARAIGDQPWRRISLDYDRETITLPEDVRIDLGGIGKGYTVDRAIGALGLRANAMVNASGDLYAAGDGPDGDGWYVGVQDPLAPERDVAVLNVNDRGVATSGSIKRNWMSGDRRYHHLIDARDRRSSNSDLLTVTVVAPTATQADVLAKTTFLLGGDDGMAMIERFDGAECIVIGPNGHSMATSGMAEYFV